MVLPVAGQRHLAAGNINFDVTIYLARRPGPDEVAVAEAYWAGLGGAAANYSVALARWGGEAFIHASTGDGPLAESLLVRLQAEGVRLDYVHRTPGEPGLVFVMVIGGRRTMIKVAGANKRLPSLPFPHFGGHIHVTSAPVEVLAKAREANPESTISYDPGGEAFRNPESIGEAGRYADWVLLNTWELARAFPGGVAKAVEMLLSGRTGFLVVKHGRGGASLYDGRGGCIRVQAPRGRVVDVTGAGDAFDAAFNATLLAGFDPGEALRLAVAAGSAKVERRGSSNMPSLRDVEAKLRETGGPEACGASVE